MPWLWTDTLADLLDAIDRVEPEVLGEWRRNPVAYRLADGQDPVALARAVLAEGEGAGSGEDAGGGGELPRSR